MGLTRSETPGAQHHFYGAHCLTISGIEGSRIFAVIRGPKYADGSMGGTASDPTPSAVRMLRGWRDIKCVHKGSCVL